jgi:hydroxymethylbilane synthase
LKISIGTRKSKLAIWQAEYVAEKLRAGGVETELVLMETRGDKVLDVAISKIGSKGVFTEELEDQLASGAIDVAVHSAKDLQSHLPGGFEIIAFTEREKINDVILSEQSIDLHAEVTLGTSSTRRVALFHHFYPNVKTVDIRGNLQTRIQKMKDGLCDGLVLAYAGVHRMDYDPMIKVELSEEEFIPAVGQGSVAVEAHSNLPEAKRAALRKLVNHTPTERRLLAERAYLAKLEGGCSIPVFALAKLNGSSIEISGGIVSLDGRERIVRSQSGEDPDSLGRSLAESVLDAGGKRILKDIRSAL